MDWLRAFHDRVIADMRRDPPWSGLEKLDALWPLFLGGGLLFAAEWLSGSKIHDTLWVAAFVGPGVIWATYLLARFVAVYAKHRR